LFDGKGTLAEGVVKKTHKKAAVIHTHTIEQIPRADSGIILAVSFAKGQRFDWLVEKCTELGVDHIAAVQFERTIKLGKDTALQRYRRISIAAAKQCGRLYLPELSGPSNLEQTLDMLKNTCPQSLLLYGDWQGEPILQLPSAQNARHRIVFIGPEGGLTEAETTLLAANGAIGVSFNRNVLRIETAAVAIGAILGACRF
jgi:16S rRNA (uracil1498-N3)-methyltransferase